MILVIITLMFAIVLAFSMIMISLKFKGSKIPREFKECLWIGMILCIIILVASFVRIGMELDFIEDPGGCPDPIFGEPKDGCWGYNAQLGRYYHDREEERTYENRK